MPSHYGSSMRKKKKMPMPKKPMRKQAVVKKKKKQLTDSQMKKLLEHSKLHAGGMRSKHMAIMMREMRKGETFSKAHKTALKV